MSILAQGKVAINSALAGLDLQLVKKRTIDKIQDNVGDLEQRLVLAQMVLPEDGDLLDLTLKSLSAEALTKFLARGPSLSERVLLIGESSHRKKVQRVVEATGRKIIGAASATPADDAVLCATQFEAETYDQLNESREVRRTLTLRDLFGSACLLVATARSLGFNAASKSQDIPHQDSKEILPDVLVRRLLGLSVLSPIEKLNEIFPLKNKTIIEFGPLDSEMTAAFVALGAKHVTCVDVRMLNLLKLSAAIQYLGWKNVSMIAEDMHCVSSQSHGKYDIAIAHGVYYHTTHPFHFLKNLITLSDTIYFGGFCADPNRLLEPLVDLCYEGETYAAQPFAEKHENAGAGIHHAGYYFIWEDLERLFRKWGLEVQLLEKEVTPPNKNAGFYCRALLRK
ncbi:MAG TPA: hypothetical protein V6D17_05515 [Candidatus Obscuribacterales bacterium]